MKILEVKEILTEVLPYMHIFPDTGEDSQEQETTMEENHEGDIFN